MPSGTVEIKLRPLKLAFVVNPTDKKALLTALELNSFLWGGIYNPIVPRFGKIPSAWKKRLPKSFSANDVIRGYLSAYDPDILVTFNDDDTKTLASYNRHVISHTEILGHFADDGTIKYGIGLPDIVRHFAHHELRFQRKTPIKMIFPIVRGSLALFSASVFGRLSDNVKANFDTAFREICGVRYERVTFQNFIDFLEPDNLFPRRLTAFHIEKIPQQFQLSNSCLFYFDAENPLDIIDYWNLRALGLTVIPIPQQSVNEPNLLKYVLDFIYEAFEPNRINPSIYHHATLIPSTSCSTNVLMDFVRLLQTTPRTHESGIPELSFQPWYPRIWNAWSRQSDGFECFGFQADSKTHSLQSLDGTLTVPKIAPQFMSKFNGHMKPRFVNEIDFHFYGSDELLAEIIPEADDGMARAINGYGLGDWRFSRKGPAYLASHADWPLSFSCPKAESVFSEWMRSRGWNISLSPAGKIARQMVKQLGGMWGTAILAHDGLIDLLCGLAGSKTISEIELRKKLNIIVQREKHRSGIDGMLKTLIDIKALSLGLEIQCQTCSIRSWFSIRDMDDTISCPNCFSTIHIPSHSPTEMKWAYRAIGPFNLPKGSYGAYCVLLTLFFFSKPSGGATTPMLSFEATKVNMKLEADLGLFFTRSEFTEEQPRLIFAECKTHMQFKNIDILRMGKLARAFPGALVVFATLNIIIARGEKSRIRAMVIRSRKNRLKGKPYSSILILTANELTSTFGPTVKWGDLTDKHKSLKDFAARDLDHMADATQQLYLDMDSWYEWSQRNQVKRSLLPSRHNFKIKPPPISDSNTPKPKIYLRVSTRMQEVRDFDLINGTN